MKYNLEETRKRFNDGEKMEFLFFYGQRISKDGSVNESCLSQWYESNFEVEDITYTCAEQYMMAEKARLFGDIKIRKEILQPTITPRQAKALGRKVSNFDEKIWRENRYGIVLAGNIAKFSQNSDLKCFLLKTEGKILVEASPPDRIWGIGLGADNPGINNPNNWRGSNLLGFALTETRDKLGADLMKNS